MATKVRYAPTNPSLPAPWKALVSVVNGEEVTYFWNPQTKVTQYEKPKSSAIPAEVLKQEAPRRLPTERSSVFNSGSDEKNDNDPDWSGSSKFGRSSDRDAITGVKRPSEGIQQNAFKRPKPGSAHPKVTPSSEVDAYRKKHEITVRGDNVPHPFMSYGSTRFPSTILREFESAGFSSPSPIQAQSWPIALQGRDIVAVAKTGSGKTLGYLIPGFAHIERHRDKDYFGSRMLVVAPTRELATQIQAEAKKFGKSSDITSTCVYGGAEKGPQLRAIQKGVDIIIATPGRLNDFLNSGKFSLERVSYVVLDEADRMLDMGFEPQIRAIFSHLPAERQTLMFTATWPKEVRKMAGDMLHTPVQVNIGNADDLAANKSITQHIEVIRRPDKTRRLQQILRTQARDARIIVFSSTKRMCDQLANNLSDLSAAAIHGDKSQEAREYALSDFRSGKSPILVATDVAARGLDVKDVRVVINYDFPTKFEDYIHRIGRTGRGGASGIAYTFFDDVQDAKFSKKLVKVLQGANQKVPKELADIAARPGNF
ncbi:hypothetical protein R1flu_002507 [Riccia fluitans]|uniref:RNA helicase n=1 Tax=Riccia fluitans TaxID=41844 RepID=A0ABD1Y6A5_9MARC